MKKNGFTLVELIATIALMALLSTIILFNITGIQSNQEQQLIDRYKKRIEDAACSYVDSSYFTDKRDNCKNKTSDFCEIKISELITDGYIDPDDKDPETNKPNSDDEIKNKSVTVKWEGNPKVKKCEFN